MSTAAYPTIEMSDVLATAMNRARKHHGPLVVTEDGKAAGVLIPFENEDDYFDWQLENDPRLHDLLDRRQAHADAGHTLSSDEVKARLGL